MLITIVKKIKKKNKQIEKVNEEFKQISNNKNNSKNFKILSIKRYFRYVKIILKKNTFLALCISSIISNTIITIKNKEYDNCYIDEEILNLKVAVISSKQEKDYYNTYIVKVIEPVEYEKTKLYINLDKEEIAEYGDLLEIKGEYTSPSIQRNYMGFNYKQYLKTKEIYGTISVEDLEVIEKQYLNILQIYLNKISNNIKEKIYEVFNENSQDIIYALVLGDTSNIDDNIYDNFKNASLSHILAISGIHISYIVIGLTKMLKKIVGKKNSYILIIILLSIYLGITKFSPSIARASIMAMLVCLANLLHRKNDFINSLGISSLILLIYNPYLILNAGYIFSYLGTVGIIVFKENIFVLLKQVCFKENVIEKKVNKSKMKKQLWNKISRVNQIRIIKKVIKLIEIISVTLSAQIMIIPISIYMYNTISIYFILTNLLVSLILSQIISGSYILVSLAYISLQISKIIAKYLELLINILILISNIGKLPYSKIYLATPKIVNIMIFYIIVIILNYIFKIYNLNDKNYKKTTILNLRINTDIRMKNTIEIIKYKYRKKINEEREQEEKEIKTQKEKIKIKKTEIKKTEIKKIKIKTIKKIILAILCICIGIKILGINLTVDYLNGNLNIHFLDVGQGDCTFIETPKGNTILIDRRRKRIW